VREIYIILPIQNILKSGHDKRSIGALTAESSLVSFCWPLEDEDWNHLSRDRFANRQLRRKIFKLQTFPFLNRLTLKEVAAEVLLVKEETEKIWWAGEGEKQIKNHANRIVRQRQKLEPLQPNESHFPRNCSKFWTTINGMTLSC
jgi:hypothetical protein